MSTPTMRHAGRGTGSTIPAAVERIVEAAALKALGGRALTREQENALAPHEVLRGADGISFVTTRALDRVQSVATPKARCSCRGCNPGAAPKAAADHAVPPPPDFVEAIRAARDPGTRAARLAALATSPPPPAVEPEDLSFLRAPLPYSGGADEAAPPPPDFVETARAMRAGGEDLAFLKAPLPYSGGVTR